MKIKLTKKQKEIIRETLDKIDNEGGKDYYFNSYTSLDSFQEDHPFLPKEVFELIKQYTEASEKIETLLSNLAEEVGEEW